MAEMLDSAEEADRNALWLAAGAIVHDPTSVPGLVSRIERDAVPIDGVPFDTTRTTGEKVDCALCGRSKNHNKGFVVTLSDQRRAIIGRDCGETKLFQRGAWEEMKASAERRKNRVLFEARSGPTLKAIDALRPYLSLCLASARLVESFLAIASQQLPDLIEGMRAARRHDGMMMRTREIPVTRLDAHGREKRSFDIERKNYVKVPSFSAFDEGLSKRLTEIKLNLDRIATDLNQDAITLNGQAIAFENLRRLAVDFRQIRVDAELCKVFFTQDFWGKVAQWGRSDPERIGNYRVNGRSVRHSDNDRTYGVLHLIDANKYDVGCFEKVALSWPRL